MGRPGEWFCAREWARLLGEQGSQAEALETLAPYLATGWWTATTTTAELLESWGRADEAIVLTRTRMELGHPQALEFCTALLARHGRGDEAFTLLRPHIDDCSLATALVEVAAGACRDEEAAALLAGGAPRGALRNCWRNARTWRARSPCTDSSTTRPPIGAASRWISRGCWLGTVVGARRSR
ncbi:hypothetical protein ACFC00_22705 [Streptomyces adustus]|uniref:hypothetical protein n=1 Tax=Streptomyces adustus TaxID=1609272 RepID=UPI0035DEB7A2